MSYSTKISTIQASLSAATTHINNTDPGIPDFYWWDNLGTPTLITAAVTALSAIAAATSDSSTLKTNLDGDFSTWVGTYPDRMNNQAQRISSIGVGIGLTDVANNQILTDITWLDGGIYLDAAIVLAGEVDIIVANNISIYGDDWAVKAAAIDAKADQITSSINQPAMSSYATCVFGKDSDVASYERTFFQNISILSSYVKTPEQANVDILEIAGGYATEIAIIQPIRDDIEDGTIPPEEAMDAIIDGARELAGIDDIMITAWNTTCVRP
jgi:hypothetical protein